MKYLLKLALIPFVYLMFMLLLCCMVLLIPADLLWVRYVGAGACLGVYIFIVFGVLYREGETALKVRISNDIERKVIVETGEDRPLKKATEYKPWKGFVAGIVVCVPLVALLLIHTILIFAVGPDYVGAGAGAGILYLMVHIFFIIPGPAASPFTYYFALIAIPLISCTMGFSYMYGAKRIWKQQSKLSDIEQSIYGDSLDNGEKSENNKR